MNDQVTSATLGGAVSGAGSGAAVGSSISPGIGTAIGALAGGVLGAVTSNKKAKGDIEAREKEIQRVQQREDTAIRRATADSLAAGVDPRIQNQAPPSAGSASVEPYQSADYTNDMVSALGQASEQLQKVFQIENDTQMQLGKQYQSMVADSDRAFKGITDSKNTLMTAAAERWGISFEDLDRTNTSLEKTVNTLDRTTNDFLSSKKFTDFYQEAHDKLKHDGGSQSESEYIKNAESWASKWFDEHGAEFGLENNAGVNGEAGISVFGPSLKGAFTESIKTMAKAYWKKSHAAEHNKGQENGKSDTSSTDWYDNTDDSWGSSHGVDTLRQNMSSTVKEKLYQTKDSSLSEFVKKNSKNSSGISENDLNNFNNEVRKLSDMQDFYRNARSMPYDKYVKTFYPRVRSFYKGMRVPSIEDLKGAYTTEMDAQEYMDPLWFQISEHIRSKLRHFDEVFEKESYKFKKYE